MPEMETGQECVTRGSACLVKLDMGGKFLGVSKGTIDNFPEFLLADLLQRCPEALKREQALRIDRDPFGFETIFQHIQLGCKPICVSLKQKVMGFFGSFISHLLTTGEC